MNIKGFTLIELIIVVTIITVISTVGVFSFLGISQNQSFQQELSTLVSKIDNSQAKLKKEFSDYEFKFYVGKEYYIYTNNKNYSNFQQNIIHSGSELILKNSFTGTGFFIIDEYRDNKYFTQHILASTGALKLPNIKKGEYHFDSQINSIPLNPIFLNFYSHFDFDESGENIVLENIIGTSFTEATIKGSIGNGRQYFFGNTQTGTFSLEFRRNGKEYNLDFNK